MDVRSLNTNYVGTDHNLLLCKLRIKGRVSHNQCAHLTARKTSRWNVHLLAQESIRNLYVTRLTERIGNNYISPDYTVEAALHRVVSNINGAATEVVAKKKTGRINNKIRYLPEVKEITARKKEAYMAFKHHPSPDRWNNYRVIRNECQSSLRRLKREYWQSRTAEFQHDLYGAQSQIWPLIRRLKQQHTEQHRQPIDMQNFHRHFQSLLSGDEATVPLIDGPGIDIKFSYEEVEQKIKSLKNRKTPGPDGIDNELIKYEGQRLATELVYMFNHKLNTGEVSYDWSLSYMVCLHKKGDKKDPNNYRGITLRKLFTSLVLRKLNVYYTPRDEQFGFRTGRSTTDALFIVRQITEKSIEYDVPAYFCIVDLVKAFDSVRITDIVDILNAYGTPKMLTSIIYNLNINLRTQLLDQGRTSDIINVGKGIRQGDLQSPLVLHCLI